ncbi:hypothetical protein ACOSQ3_017233 [Xanthoceras sorbifolium]
MVNVLDAQIMPRDLLILEKLERYRIFIGDMWEWSDNYEGVKNVLGQLKGEGFPQLKHLLVQNGREI